MVKTEKQSFPFAFQFQCENEFVWLWSLYCSSLEIWAVMVLIDCFFISTIKQKLHFSLACSGIRIYTGRFKKPRASESEYVWKWVLTVLMYLWRVVDPIWLTLRASAYENEIKGSKLSQNHPSSAFFPEIYIFCIQVHRSSGQPPHYIFLLFILFIWTHPDKAFNLLA